MAGKNEVKLVLRNIPLPLAGMPEQDPATPEEERLKPGDPLLLLEQDDASLNGVWAVSEGPWARTQWEA
jgi:hypothetical protein